MKLIYFCTKCQKELKDSEIKTKTVEALSIPDLISVPIVERSCNKGHVVYNYSPEGLARVKKTATPPEVAISK